MLCQFSQLDQPQQTVQELVELLVPAINTLNSHIKCVATFHDPVFLYTNTLSSTLDNTIINCIPIYTHQTFFPKLGNFKEANAQNESAPNIFNFSSDKLSKEAKKYASYPLKYDNIPSSHKVDIEPI